MLHGKLQGRRDRIGQEVTPAASLHRRLRLHCSTSSCSKNTLVAMHHLHPRSRSTSTLFTATLFISFLVVGAPHLLPCPADRRQFADSFETSDGKRYRRKRKDVGTVNEETQEIEQSEEESIITSKPKRECPVPRPGGIVGQIMGFKNEERPKPAEVIIQPLNTKRPSKLHREAGEVP